MSAFPTIREMPDSFLAAMPQLHETNTKAFQFGMLRVLVSQEPDGWHLSISHPHRYPSWDEIKHARYELCPRDITMAMILPPSDEFVNLHPNCFHLYQIPNEK